MKWTTCLLAVLILFGCSKGYNPDEHLSAQDQYNQIWKIIRYLARAPENVTPQERFYNGYDSYYEKQAGLHRLDAYFIGDDGTHYFLVSRRAPSLTEKRVATGGKFREDGDGNLTYYEEVFRTWKMPDSVLARKSVMLFDKMVKSESLDPYLTKNSWPEEYIEFPDERTVYDVKEREWKGKPIE